MEMGSLVIAEGMLVAGAGLAPARRGTVAVLTAPAAGSAPGPYLFAMKLRCFASGPGAGPYLLVGAPLCRWALPVLLLAPAAGAVAQAPVLTGLTPAANARAVPRGASVVAAFSQPLTAASAGALKVFSSQRGGLRGGGTAAVAGNTLTFAPTAYDFRPGETVQYTVTTAAASAGGRLARARVGQFTAAAAVAPATFATGLDPSVGTDPFSSALGDLDGDGDLDLVVANGMSGQVSLRFNNSRGVFSGTQTLVAGNAPGGGVALADVDGDGDLDLLKADQGMGIGGGTVFVRLNNGLGTFSGTQSVVVGRGPIEMAVGDVDGDGDLDFAVTSSSTFNVSVRLNDGAGNFSGTQDVPVGSNSYGVALGDLDGDGDLDLAATSYFNNAVSVRLNDGAGNFTGTSSVGVGQNPWSVALADLDGDGDLDLTATNSTGSTVSVRLNNGSAGFGGTQDLPTGNGPFGLALGDLDGDGDLDLLATNYSSQSITVGINDGTGTFAGAPAVPVGFLPSNIHLGDVDGDGDLDFVALNYDGGTASVRLNGGNGPLTTAAAAAPAALAVFPNPATGWVQLHLPPAATRAELLDAQGRAVRTVPAAAGAVVLDLTGLPAGLYLVRAAGQMVRLLVE